ncbi:hypothetical protein QQZ08_009800 [Neonectria magnoliae]|uniref:Cytochrome P450 n=1 Tax=Neonectria magnoliae TaxID=2732573 RepID=A0ABR1HLL1_9HYPO
MPFLPTGLDDVPSPLSLAKYIAAAIAVLAAIYLIQNEVARYRTTIKNLPGPRGWPVVGNLFQASKASRNCKRHLDEIPAVTYARWARTYGPVFQIQLGNTTAIVVNSAESAKQLLIGQRHAMNSRPTFYVFHKQVSKSVTSIGTSPWDESCKRRRKLAATSLNRPRVESYAPILNLEAREFLKDLYSECHNGSVEIDFVPAVKHFSINLSLTLNYGTRVSSVKSLYDDPLFTEISYVESEISKLRDTSTNYANYIPLLRYWTPIAGLLGLNSGPKDHAADIGRRRLAYNDTLLNRLKDEVSRGEDKPCIQGGVLRDPESATLTREELISVSLSMMAVSDFIARFLDGHED